MISVDCSLESPSHFSHINLPHNTKGTVSSTCTPSNQTNKTMSNKITSDISGSLLASCVFLTARCSRNYIFLKSNSHCNILFFFGNQILAHLCMCPITRPASSSSDSPLEAPDDIGTAQVRYVPSGQNSCTSSIQVRHRTTKRWKSLSERVSRLSGIISPSQLFTLHPRTHLRSPPTEEGLSACGA